MCDDCGTAVHRRCVSRGLQRAFTGRTYRCLRCMQLGMSKLQVRADGQAMEAPPAMKKLFEEGMRLEARALEDSTQAQYAGHLRRLEAFAEQVLGVSADAMFPVGPHAMPWEFLYLWLVQSAPHITPATADNYCKAIADWHAQKGLREECPDHHHRVKRLRRGIWKAAGGRVVPQRREPLSWNWFCLLVRRAAENRSAMARDRRCALRDLWWLCGGFLGLARRSELTAFKASDLRVYPEAQQVEFHFRKSKTDPGGVGASVRVDARSVPGLDLCKLAVEYQCLLRAAGVGLDGPLFGWDADARKPYACKGDGIVTRLRRLLEEAGREAGTRVDTKAYAGHSLRRGGAQALRDAGVPREVIMAIGRWRSSAVDVYLDVLQDDWLVAGSRALAVGGWGATTAGGGRR